MFDKMLYSCAKGEVGSIDSFVTIDSHLRLLLVAGCRVVLHAVKSGHCVIPNLVVLLLRVYANNPVDW
jgi:hypothetical protein